MDENQSPAATPATDEKRPEQKPTIGRIVHYHTSAERTVPAIITRVWDEQPGAVALEVFGLRGGDGERTAVNYSEEPEPGHWSWPPRA